MYNHLSLYGKSVVHVVTYGIRKIVEAVYGPKREVKFNLQINFTFKIREYGFREDGLKYWAAIKRYTRGILDIYYKSDLDITEDYELQNWIAEVKVLN